MGFVIEETDKHLTLASSLGEDGSDYAGEMTIPKVSITKRRRVKV